MQAMHGKRCLLRAALLLAAVCLVVLARVEHLEEALKLESGSFEPTQGSQLLGLNTTRADAYD